jgi:hypothetical protein
MCIMFIQHRKKGNVRRIRLPILDEKCFKNHTKLDDYLDLNYNNYISMVTGMHNQLEQVFGGRPDITILIRNVELYLREVDRGLYKYLDEQGYSVGKPDKYLKVTDLFARVIVSESLPEIFK